MIEGTVLSEQGECFEGGQCTVCMGRLGWGQRTRELWGGTEQVPTGWGEGSGAYNGNSHVGSPL